MCMRVYIGMCIAHRVLAVSGGVCGPAETDGRVVALGVLSPDSETATALPSVDSTQRVWEPSAFPGVFTSCRSPQWC